MKASEQLKDALARAKNPDKYWPEYGDGSARFIAFGYMSAAVENLLPEIIAIESENEKLKPPTTTQGE